MMAAIHSRETDVEEKKISFLEKVPVVIIHKYYSLCQTCVFNRNSKNLRQKGWKGELECGVMP